MKERICPSNGPNTLVKSLDNIGFDCVKELPNPFLVSHTLTDQTINRSHTFVGFDGNRVV